MMQSRQMIIREVQYGSDGYRDILSMRDRLLRAPLGLTWSEADLAGESSEYMGRQLKLQAATAVFARAQELERQTLGVMTQSLGGAKFVDMAA